MFGQQMDVEKTNSYGDQVYHAYTLISIYKRSFSLCLLILILSKFRD